MTDVGTGPMDRAPINSTLSIQERFAAAAERDRDSGWIEANRTIIDSSCLTKAGEMHTQISHVLGAWLTTGQQIEELLRAGNNAQAVSLLQDARDVVLRALEDLDKAVAMVSRGVPGSALDIEVQLVAVESAENLTGLLTTMMQMLTIIEQAQE